ncbi:MAG TPA: hypothetical protein VGZ22_18055 [Isosphaeraceae bacterium]|jgi:hypothetical protein|nr:hypothetical protein [Isosphaeraceae bacterium]
MTGLPQLSGWIPIRVVAGTSGPLVEWCYLGDRQLVAPFFEQSVGECMRQPFNLVFRHQTPIESLDEWSAASPGLSPAGFIFHMSRCGSTLISQLLASLPSTVVISEAEPIDTILRISAVDDDRRIGWLRGLVSALGQRRQGRETHLIIKLDSWNTCALPLIERAFPGVPWVFLYREPVEVLVSQVKQRALYMIPGMLGHAPIDPATVLLFQTKPEEYCARVLAAICRAGLQQLQLGRGTALNYRQLPSAVWTSLLDLFGIRPSPPALKQMQLLSQFNAKTPALYFEDDTAAKQREASDAVRRAADEWLRPLHDQLEAIRNRRESATASTA